MQIRRVFGLFLAVVLLASAGPVLAQRNNQNNRQQPAAMPADPDTVTLVRLVDAVAMGTQPAPSDIPVNWDSNHFVKGQAGITYIPFTLDIKMPSIQIGSPVTVTSTTTTTSAAGQTSGSRSATTTTVTRPAPAALYIRVVDKNAPPPAPVTPPAAQNNQNNNNRNNRNQPPPPAPAPPRYAWDNINFIDIPEDGKVSRAIALQPGEYEAFIAVKERSAPVDPKAKPAPNAPAPPVGKMTVYRKSLSVPNFNTTELATSSVILASTVEPIAQQLSPAEQEANPYVFGPMRIVPVREGRFSKSSELNVIFWIYGAGAAASGKPDVTVEYNFHTRQADGSEKYFNKTAPQELNAQTLPPEFSVAAGHQLPGSLAVGLAPFPVGDYRLEIKVTDKTNNKTVTQNVNFTVLPV